MSPHYLFALAAQHGLPAGSLTGANWFRQELQYNAGHTEDQLPRKYNWKTIVANDENYALAA